MHVYVTVVSAVEASRSFHGASGKGPGTYGQDLSTQKVCTWHVSIIKHEQARRGFSERSQQTHLARDARCSVAQY